MLSGRIRVGLPAADSGVAGELPGTSARGHITLHLMRLRVNASSPNCIAIQVQHSFSLIPFSLLI